MLLVTEDECVAVKYWKKYVFLTEQIFWEVVNDINN